MTKEFKPKPGQTDYTYIRRAPVINCVVRNDNEILLVKRSEKLNFYPGYWNGISGFLDDDKSIEQKVHEEMSEELGIAENCIKSMHEGEVFEVNDESISKIWIIHPVLVDVLTRNIALNWEAEEYRWVAPHAVDAFRLLPSFPLVLRELFEK